MKEYLEQLEDQLLAPYACKSQLSKGRKYFEIESQNRTCFQRDRDRIIHSKAFRRLRHKTQVFIATENDHSRSRLTHTIEVAQISRHLSRILKLNEDLTECIALAHDLGHTPFGHSGEAVLNQLMEKHGGFEHNLQSYRVIDFLEQKYPQFPGLNLSYELRAGLLKHKAKRYSESDAEMKLITLESQVTNVADEVAYNNHDIDDGLQVGLLNEKDLEKNVQVWAETKAEIKKENPTRSDQDLHYLINSRLIGNQIKDIINNSQNNIKKMNIQTLDDLQKLSLDVISFSEDMKEKNKELRLYLYKKFYTHHQIYRMIKKGQDIIEKMFAAFNEDIKLLPEHVKNRITSNYSQERVITDYIAGMTDTFAIREYNALFK